MVCIIIPLQQSQEQLLAPETGYVLHVYFGFGRFIASARSCPCSTERERERVMKTKLARFLKANFAQLRHAPLCEQTHHGENAFTAIHV